MSNKTMETLTWVLIYSGLLLVCLGWFLQRDHPVPGWALVAAGALDTLLGVVLIAVRARRDAQHDDPRDAPPGKT